MNHEPGDNMFGAAQMKVGRLDLQLLSIDELWALHEKVGAVLSEKITAEKRALEERLARLNRGLAEKAGIRRAALKTGERRARRRKYPPVLPKYKNPGDPSETWAGRGKQPRWLVSQLKAGKKIDDFLINRTRQRAKRRSA
jgi:DNA-binding protein H-NS